MDYLDFNREIVCNVSLTMRSFVLKLKNYTGYRRLTQHLPFARVSLAKNKTNLNSGNSKIWLGISKNASASGGLRPPDQGLCPWTPLGAQPPDPHYSSRSALTFNFPPTGFDLKYHPGHM